MQFLGNTKMADLIHDNYLLLPILNRFDIQLGFGDKTIEDVCRSRNVNLDFFLLIINSFHDHNFFPNEDLMKFPLSLILDYIKKSHSHYLNYKVPQIEELIDNHVRKADSSHKNHAALIQKFFAEYKDELIVHIQDEENRIFPYVIAIDSAYNKKESTTANRKLIKENSISKYAKEHTNIEDKLYDLKNILIKYMPPIEDYTSSNTLLIELFRLERDLADHARIEDKVLVPKVQNIESEILSRGK